MPLTPASAATSSAWPITKLITAIFIAVFLLTGVLAISHVDNADGSAGTLVSIADSVSSAPDDQAVSSTTAEVVAATVGGCIFGVVCCLIAVAWLRRTLSLVDRRRPFPSLRRVFSVLKPRAERVPHPSTALLCVARIRAWLQPRSRRTSGLAGRDPSHGRYAPPRGGCRPFRRCPRLTIAPCAHLAARMHGTSSSPREEWTHGVRPQPWNC